MLPAAFQLRVLRRTVCLSLSVTNASALSFRSGAEGASLEGILFMCSYLAVLIVASADLTGLFVTDASLDKASAMPKTKFRKKDCRGTWGGSRLVRTGRRPADQPGINFQHRLVLAHEPPKPSARCQGRRPRRSRSRSQSHGSGFNPHPSATCRLLRQHFLKKGQRSGIV